MGIWEVNALTEYINIFFGLINAVSRTNLSGGMPLHNTFVKIGKHKGKPLTTQYGLHAGINSHVSTSATSSALATSKSTTTWLNTVMTILWCWSPYQWARSPAWATVPPIRQFRTPNILPPTGPYASWSCHLQNHMPSCPTTYGAIYPSNLQLLVPYPG